MTDEEQALILAPLIAVCRRRRIGYCWRTTQIGDHWEAEAQAGYFTDGKPHGHCPRWGGQGNEEADALRIAVSAAVDGWDDSSSYWISPTLRDLMIR